MDTLEKVYCTGHDNNDALVATLAGQNNNNAMTAAMMNNGMNNWCNNPFVYLVWMMFANRMWNNGDGNTAQLDSLRNQMSDNQNSNLIMDAVKGNNVAIGQLASNLNCDFNNLNSAICGVRAGIQEVAGNINFSAERVINAANLGDMNIVQQLKDCCCQTQQNIIKMSYEQQLATCNQTSALTTSINTVNSGLERGFSSIGYQMATDKCDIIRAGQDNTQRIIDTLNNHWTADLQQRYNDARLELSQQRQNATLIAALKPTTTATA